MTATPSTPALFLDRDGVINIDTGHLYRIEDFRFVDGIFDLCRAARAQGMPIHVVTNQAGIGRGYYTEADFQTLTAWMRAAFAAEGLVLDAVHHCPHHEHEGVGDYRRACPRRKPEPGMILDAAAAHGLDLPRSVMVGDRPTDMQAAAAAGVGTRILFAEAESLLAACPPGTEFVRHLRDATAILRRAATP